MAIYLVFSAFTSRPISLKATKACVSFLTVRLLLPMNGKILENIYEMFCGSEVLSGVEVWGVKREGELIDKIQGRTLKEVIKALGTQRTEQQNGNLVEN